MCVFKGKQNILQNMTRKDKQGELTVWTLVKGFGQQRQSWKSVGVGNPSLARMVEENK